MDKLPTVRTKEVLENAVQKTSVESVNSLGNRALKSAKDIEKATAGFEALLLHEMLKSMWATVQPTGFLGEDSNQAEIYRDMLHQALADSIAEGEGIGVKKFLKNELLKSLGEASKSKVR